MRGAACAAAPFARLQGDGVRHHVFRQSFLPRTIPNLRIIDGDIRDTAKFAAAVAGHDAVVNLACISNDASFELDEDLSTSINLNAFELVQAAKKAG